MDGMTLHDSVNEDSTTTADLAPGSTQALAELTGAVLSTRTCRRPATLVSDLIEALHGDGFVHVPTASLAYIPEQQPSQARELRQSWNRLGPDEYIDGPVFRTRRYAMFEGWAATGDLVLKPHGPHYQKHVHNVVFGDLERWFLPIEPEIVQNPAWRELVGLALDVFVAARPPKSGFHVETHQFRIEPIDHGIGRPTPEGLHRDGRDWVAIFMIARENLLGGETLICDGSNDEELARVTMTRPFEAILVDDHAVKHAVSEVRRADPGRAAAYRDVLVATFIDTDEAAAEVSRNFHDRLAL